MELGVITWNMRGATLQGDKQKKVELLEQLVNYYKGLFGKEKFPIFLLQESGNLFPTLQGYTHWRNDYHMGFADPIAAGHDRCTTGLLIPSAYPLAQDFQLESQRSGTRSFITAQISVNSKTILLGSIHAVASSSAAEDDRAFLQHCCMGNEYVVCGGDFNCAPEDMEASKQFTPRQREQGMQYTVEYINDFTHMSPGGTGSVLDYICVKNVTVGLKDKLVNSQRRSERDYSDHCPILYQINC